MVSPVLPTTHPMIRITTSNEVRFQDKMKNIDLDEMVVTAGKTARLATNGLGPCFAVCARGWTKKLTPVLAMWHKSPFSDGLFRSGFQSMEEKMVADYSCLPESIETYIIGGYDAFTDLDDDELPSTEAEEEAMMRYQKRANICGSLFRFAKPPDEALNVVLTPNCIFVSKEEIFDALSDCGQATDSSIENDDDLWMLSH